LNNLYEYRYHLAAAIVIASTGLALLFISNTCVPTSKEFNIRARQYSYDPPIINVNRGDTIHIKLKSLDVIHGFYLEGHNINVHIFPMAPFMRIRDELQPDGYRPVDEILFTATKFGKFRYRCSHMCGTLHPFMQGEFIVGPNYPYHAGIGAAVGICLAGCFLLALKGRKQEEADKS
jgi:heme/copper-type cytochrome/quinol oxidase subunit 2